MNFQFSYRQQHYTFTRESAFPISLPLTAGETNPNGYYAPLPRFETIRMGNFVGSVAEGGPVNYQTLTLTPHGNGTHTECYGHISPDPAATIRRCLTQSLFVARLISVAAQTAGVDQVVRLVDAQRTLGKDELPEALIIRTLPNDESKRTRQYSGRNPPYLETELLAWLAAQEVQHLVVDLPSVDREEDGGRLAGHRAFWQYSAARRSHCTITELAFVPETILDGLYLLELQIMDIETDASPSRPLLYPLAPISR